MPFKLLFDRNDFYIYPWYIADLTVTKDMEEIVGCVVKKVFVTFKKDFVSGYYDIKSTNKIGEILLKKIINEKGFFESIKEKIYQKADDLMNFCKRINKHNIDKLTDDELLEIYSEFMQKLRAMRKWGWIPVFLDGCMISFLTNEIMEKFGKFLKEKNKKDELGKLYSILSSSEKKSEIQVEELARLDLLLKVEQMENSTKIIKAIKNNNVELIKKEYPKVFKLANTHTKKFGWLPYAYEGPVMDLEYLFKVLQDNLNKDVSITKQKEVLLKHYKEIKQQKKSIFNELEVPQDIVYLFQISSELMFIKDWRKGIYQKSYVVMDKVLEEIAKRLKYTLKELKYLVFEEVKEALQGGKAEYYQKKAKNRSKASCYLVQNGSIKVFEGKECEEVIKKQLKEQIKEKQEFGDVNVLKGMTAYAGKVRGIVKIVLVKQDVSKVEEGDILVSSATNPDLIAAMKKAAAFVTDIGGIICHAAIVSRELKKPCVIGTKIATKVLKDGDEVEVDADQGIVTILKKL